MRAHLAMLRTELGRFPRQVSGYSLEHLLPEHGGDVAKALVGTEGTWRSLRRRPCSWSRPRATALAVLGYPDMATAADDVPALLACGPLALEGIDARLVDVVRRHRGPAAVPPLPDGGGWLFVETGGATRPRRWPPPARCPAAAAGRGARAAGPQARGCGGSARTAPGWRAGRRTTRRRGRAGRTRRCRRSGSAPTCASSPTCCRARGGRAGLRALRRRLRARAARPAAGRPAAAFRAFLLDAADLVAAHGGSLSGEHGDGRARGELLPRCTPPTRSPPFAGVKALFDPADLLNPGVIVDPAPVDADLRLPRPAAAARRRAVRLRLRPRRRRPDHRGAPLRRGRQVPGRHQRGRGSCAPRTWPPATRRTSPAAGPGCCRRWPTGARRRRLVGAGGARSRSTCAWPARPAAATAPPGSTWPPTRRRCSTAATAAGCGRPPLRARLAAALERGSRAGRRGWSTRAAPRPLRALALRLAASTVGGRCRPSPRRRSAAGAPAASGRAARRPGAAVGRLLHRRLLPGGGAGGGRGAGGRGLPVLVPDAAVCCGLTWITTGQLDGARRRLRRLLDVLAPHADGAAGGRAGAVLHRGAALGPARAAARRPAGAAVAAGRARSPSC